MGDLYKIPKPKKIIPQNNNKKYKNNDDNEYNKVIVYCSVLSLSVATPLGVGEGR